MHLQPRKVSRFGSTLVWYECRPHASAGNQIFARGAHAARVLMSRTLWSLRPAPKTLRRRLINRLGLSRCRSNHVYGFLQGVADEGGYWPAFDTNEAALDNLVAAIERAGSVPGDQVSISSMVAASEFGEAGLYRLGLEERELDSDAQHMLVG